MATWPTTVPNATTTTAMTAAANTSDQRERAPASLLSDDADTEPPTGMPRNTPAARLATPWPTKSRDASGYCPSGFGKFAEMPAPCTRPTNASETAGSNRAGTRRSRGSSGVGRPSMATPRSASVATCSQSSRYAAAEVATTATTSPSDFSGVRSSSTINAMVATPTSSVRPSRRSGLITVLTALTTRLGPSAAYPVRLASCPSTMLTPTALMKPTMTALDTNRRIVPSFASPATSITAPVNIDRVTSARVGSSESRSTATSAISIAMAPVPCTAMKVELVLNAPARVPTM